MKFYGFLAFISLVFSTASFSQVGDGPGNGTGPGLDIVINVTGSRYPLSFTEKGEKVTIDYQGKRTFLREQLKTIVDIFEFPNEESDAWSFRDSLPKHLQAKFATASMVCPQGYCTKEEEQNVMWSNGWAYIYRKPNGGRGIGSRADARTYRFRTEAAQTILNYLENRPQSRISKKAAEEMQNLFEVIYLDQYL